MVPISYFTSESVSAGHPDKLADQISDTVVDTLLELDPHGKAAVETMIGPQYLVVGGELWSSNPLILDQVRAQTPDKIRSLLKRIGYTDRVTGFDFDKCDFQLRLSTQSREIRAKVDRADDTLGAGDQGLMFGYACDETESLMPAALDYAHQLLERLDLERVSGAVEHALPDAKAQVTVAYRGNDMLGVSTIVLSSQHRPTNLVDFRQQLISKVIDPTIPTSKRTRDCRVVVNPGGSFVLGGPAADTGLTGRKIIVDTYGGSAPHGGGAFSGKDPSKVDRSAAYAARWVAKTVVASGLARRCTVQIAYAIGETQPVSLLVDTHQTGLMPDQHIESAVRQLFDLSPKGIIDALGLRRPIYQKSAAYGHFGRNFSWESTSLAEPLNALIREMEL